MIQKMNMIVFKNMQSVWIRFLAFIFYYPKKVNINLINKKLSFFSEMNISEKLN
jgi:hypothetical protein